MAKFNLKKARKTRPIDALREIAPGIRHGDLDMEDEEIQYLADVIRSVPEKDAIRIAVHGRGDNWTEVGPGFSPYNTSPLVNPSPTGFGGRRWRENFPGGGDHHINDDSDKSKNTKGRATDEDFDPNLRRNKINDKLREDKKNTQETKYVVRINLGPEEYGTEDLAKELFGEDGMFDDNSVYVEVDSYERAIEIERNKKNEWNGHRIQIEPLNEIREKEQ